MASTATTTIMTTSTTTLRREFYGQIWRRYHPFLGTTLSRPVTTASYLIRNDLGGGLDTTIPRIDPSFRGRRRRRCDLLPSSLLSIQQPQQQQQQQYLSSFTDVIPPLFDNLSFWGGSGYVLKTIHGDGLVPYWACISLTNVLVRVSLLPLVVSGAHTQVKLGRVAPEVQFLVTLYQHEAKVLKEGGAPPEARRKHVSMNLVTLREIYRLHKVNPLHVFRAPLLQLPFFWYFAVDLRKIVRGSDAELANELTTGGWGWFENLTEPDPWYVLPIVSGSLLYLNVELAMGKNSLGGQTSSQSNVMILMKDGFQSLSLFIPSFMATSPAGTQIYLCTTFLFTLGQSAALRQDMVRALLGLPLRDAPSPPPKLVEEFMQLFRREKEVAQRRQKTDNDLIQDPVGIPGQGTVLAPGFVGSQTERFENSSIRVVATSSSDLPKPRSLLLEPHRPQPPTPLPTTTIMPDVPLEVMEAANQGRPPPKPIIMAPLNTTTTTTPFDGVEIAKRLKQKKKKKQPPTRKKKGGKR